MQPQTEPTSPVFQSEQTKLVIDSRQQLWGAEEGPVEIEHAELLRRRDEGAGPRGQRTQASGPRPADPGLRTQAPSSLRRGRSLVVMSKKHVGCGQLRSPRGRRPIHARSAAKERGASVPSTPRHESNQELF